VKHELKSATATIVGTSYPDLDDDITITVGGNNPALPDVSVALNVIRSGFGFKDLADKNAGKAAQSAAYACIVLWMHWRNGGNALRPNETAPDLLMVIHTHKAAKAARDTLKAWFVEAILPEAVSQKNVNPEESSAYVNKRNNEVGLIGRGMHLASILLNCGVTAAMFNKTAYVFAVPPSMLLMPGWTPVGRAANEKSPVLLNRLPLAALDKNKNDALRRPLASVAQLQNATKERMGLKVPKVKGESVELAKVTPELLASKCELSTLVIALHKAFVRNDSRAAHAPDKLTNPLWTMLTEIAEESETIQRTEAFATFIQHQKRIEALPNPVADTDTDAAAA